MTDESGGNEPNSATTETRELTVSRVVEAPPERVYEAFVDPDELAEWYHPPGFGAEVHDFDATEGGSYRITMAGQTPETEEHAHTYDGNFEVLEPGQRIVQRETPPDAGGEMMVTITFEDVADGTEVTVTLEIPAAWPDGAIEGWEAALGNLTERLEGA